MSLCKISLSFPFRLKADADSMLQKSSSPWYCMKLFSTVSFLVSTSVVRLVEFLTKVDVYCQWIVFILFSSTFLTLVGSWPMETSSSTSKHIFSFSVKQLSFARDDCSPVTKMHSVCQINEFCYYF